MENKFYFNEDNHQWERIDRVQKYKGVVIQSITYHFDYHGAENHREYRLIYPDGRTGVFGINKRGGNIKEIKFYIDFNRKYGLI